MLLAAFPIAGVFRKQLDLVMTHLTLGTIYLSQVASSVP